MIKYRKLIPNDIGLLDDLISSEGKEYIDFLSMGWSINQIKYQLNKKTNLSFGVFQNEILISFVLGDLFNIEKISEYEILLLYVCKNVRKKGLGTNLLGIIKKNNSHLKKIYLEVSKNNLEGVLFYKKMKFKITHIRKNYFCIKNKRIDALAMMKIY